MLFVQSLNRAVHGLKNSDSVPISPVGGIEIVLFFCNFLVKHRR
jgi:hypothetical protein